MPLRLKVFTLKYDPKLAGFDDTCIRRFLADKQLVSAREHFYFYEGIPHISVFTEYSTEANEIESDCEKSDNSEKKDYLDQLDEVGRMLFDSLREWRSERAREDGIPVFLIASNRMLADVVLMKPVSLKQLREINGFGEGKVKRYGADLLGMLPSESGAAPDE